MVERYAISSERKRILSGLLDYRDALFRMGMGQGFQWLAGSFVEDVEAIRGRPPKDIDVVTFLPIMGDSEAIEGIIVQNDWLVDPLKCYEKFKVDGYLINLMSPSHLVVKDTTYWFGLFSHQRVTGLWKGMLHVPLPSDDQEARKLLNALRENTVEAEGGENAQTT